MNRLRTLTGPVRAAVGWCDRDLRRVAALALAAALPAHPGRERATLFTVIGVSALSTVAGA